MVSKEPLSDAIQHYLREIYKLAQVKSPVSITALSQAQGVAPASASGMVKKLAALGLAEHARYRGVTLTARVMPVVSAAQGSACASAG